MSDQVNTPSHYAKQYPFEVIELIDLVLNELCKDVDQFTAYCIGNELKYRLRAGFKGDAQEDINKALKYQEFRRSRMVQA